MKWVILSLICILTLLVLYILYKLVWYAVVMIKLRIVLNRSDVEFVKPFYKVIFGRKGQRNFVIHSNDSDFVVSVISYITNHSRLNIEKIEQKYFIDVRRKNYLFNEFYRKSGEPELSVLHRSETSLMKSELLLEESGSDASSVLLFYPKPKDLTYADKEMKYLYSWDKIGDHSIIFIEDLKAILNK